MELLKESHNKLGFVAVKNVAAVPRPVQTTKLVPTLVITTFSVEESS
jgi:hypothetical protein